MDTFVLTDHITASFDGILAVADIHGDIESLTRAVKFARSENYFIVFLGDLVDRGKYPFETVKLVHEIVYDGHGAFIIGNHDDKMHRYAKGADVRFSRDATRTLEDVGTDRMDEFLKMYTSLCEDKFFTSFYHHFGDISMVHAAVHPSMWEDTKVIKKEAKYRFIVGETNGKSDEDGYPVRLYSWISEIPSGKTVIVGHDRAPIHNVLIDKPMVCTNENGGKAIFLDTGCGKGGYLSGALILHDKNGFRFEKLIDFRGNKNEESK